jgi:hypothetical protein
MDESDSFGSGPVVAMAPNGVDFLWRYYLDEYNRLRTLDPTSLLHLELQLTPAAPDGVYARPGDPAAEGYLVDVAERLATSVPANIKRAIDDYRPRNIVFWGDDSGSINAPQWLGLAQAIRDYAVSVSPDTTFTCYAFNDEAWFTGSSPLASDPGGGNSYLVFVDQDGVFQFPP